jgi:hypothetical protein
MNCLGPLDDQTTALMRCNRNATPTRAVMTRSSGPSAALVRAQPRTRRASLVELGEASRPFAAARARPATVLLEYLIARRQRRLAIDEARHSRDPRRVWGRRSHSHSGSTPSPPSLLGPIEATAIAATIELLYPPRPHHPPPIGIAGVAEPLGMPANRTRRSSNEPPSAVARVRPQTPVQARIITQAGQRKRTLISRPTFAWAVALTADVTLKISRSTRLKLSATRPSQVP